MISLRNVTKDYVLDDEITITPVRRLSLEIEAGDFVMIVGRSGSGKSTLLNLVAGLIRPTEGQILIDNTDISTMADKEISALRSRKMGFMFQYPSLLPSLTVLENVLLPAGFASRNGQSEARQRAERLLKTIGLGDRTDLYPRHLSGGEQKRAVIARALINTPPIVLADEPTSDLDEQTEAEVMNMMKDIHRRGVTILMVTHNLQLASFVTRTLQMENGVLTEYQAESDPVKGNGRHPPHPRQPAEDMLVDSIRGRK